jgi:hypothetical protein
MGSVARMKFLGLVIGLSLYLSACGGGGGSSNGPGGTTQPTLSSITVTPATVALIAGQTQQLTATANYSDGSTKDVLANIQKEQTKLNNSASPFSFYPVISLGFGCRF